MHEKLKMDGRSQKNKEISGLRHGEIDVIRAVAIVLMVLFHLVYDLKVFAGVEDRKSVV